MTKKIAVFDTTLRDGEQSPGCSMNLTEKLRVAKQLEYLGVDVIEAGFPAVESDHLQGILAPAGTPPAIVNRLNQEIVRIINAPDVRKRLIDLGFVPVGNTPQEFAEVIKFQVGKWSRIVKDAGIRAE